MTKWPDAGAAIILIAVIAIIVILTSLDKTIPQEEKRKVTKREGIVLIVIGISIPILGGIPQEILNRHELLWLVFVVLPLGVLIATDPERIKKG
jgi:uncharacterized membrane protein (DUF441 family)